jgi:hypothetical protein
MTIDKRAGTAAEALRRRCGWSDRFHIGLRRRRISQRPASSQPRALACLIVNELWLFRHHSLLFATYCLPLRGG